MNNYETFSEATLKFAIVKIHLKFPESLMEKPLPSVF